MTLPIRVCFVCLGNICRSPTAEGVMLKLLGDSDLAHAFTIDRAGTGGHHAGERPDPRTLRAAKARGIHLPSRARRFNHEDFARFDYVLAMDGHNRADLLRLARADGEREKVHAFLSFADEPGLPSDVPDPYYGGHDGFEEVLDLCESACRGFLAHVRREHGF